MHSINVFNNDPLPVLSKAPVSQSELGRCSAKGQLGLRTPNFLCQVMCLLSI